MIFGTDQPGPITWTTSGTAAGSAILGTTAQFTDGRPDTLGRIQWIGGAQTTSSGTSLRADWAAAQAIRVCALSNISLPPGTSVNVSFRRAGDAAGTYPYVPSGDTNNPQRIQQLERGEQTIIFVMPVGTTPVIGARFTFVNDVNGVASIAASSTFTIGQVIIRSGLECDIKPGWSIKRTDPTVSNFSNQTPYTNPGSPFRVFQFEFPLDVQTAYYGDAAAPTLIDYEEIVAKLDRGKSVFYLPRYRNAAGVIDPQILHRAAFLGTLTQLNTVTQKTGPYFDSDRFTVLESPIPT